MRALRCVCVRACVLCVAVERYSIAERHIWFYRVVLTLPRIHASRVGGAVRAALVARDVWRVESLGRPQLALRTYPDPIRFDRSTCRRTDIWFVFKRCFRLCYSVSFVRVVAKALRDRSRLTTIVLVTDGDVDDVCILLASDALRYAYDQLLKFMFVVGE